MVVQIFLASLSELIHLTLLLIQQTTKEMLTLITVVTMFSLIANVSLNVLISKTFMDSKLMIQSRLKLWLQTLLEIVTGLIKATVHPQ